MNRTVSLLAIAVLLAAAAGAAAIYGIKGRQGNDALACAGARENAQAMAGLNHGEVAAFQLAAAPQYTGDLRFVDENGAATGLADHRGQFVLLNLWATWCAPCREEMPALARLQEEMGGENFQVLPVSVDLGTAEKPLRFYEELGLAALPFRHDGEMTIFQRLKSMSIAFGLPVTVLVDPQGCVLGQINGPADWASEDAQALIRAAITAASVES